MEDETAVAKVNPAAGALALPDEQQFKRDIQAVKRFQDIVHANLVENQDYGIIPGTGNKPTLLKPGAEKIAKLLNLADTYEIMDRQENWDKPFFRYIIKARLTVVGTTFVVSEGLGECNSMEAKYRWREAQKKCPVCGASAIIKGKEQYGGGWLCFAKKGGCGAKFKDGDESIEGQPSGRVENDDIYSLVNTIIKMAKKRALVDAALSAGRLSNVFTQDIEDIKDGEFREIKQDTRTNAPAESVKATGPQEKNSGVSGGGTELTRGEKLQKVFDHIKARKMGEAEWLTANGFLVKTITGMGDNELAEALTAIEKARGV